jgi:RNA polymerase sigma-70 factor (ECF subfamily)
MDARATVLHPGLHPGLVAPLTQGARVQGLRMAGTAAQAAEKDERRRSDAALVARSLKGDGEAFGQIVERYQRQVYWIAHDVIMDAEEAKDVTQETFLRAHGALRSFDASRDLLNWLYRIARNLAIDALRRRKRRAPNVEDLTEVADRPAASGAQRVEASAEADRLRDQVDRVLADLPTEYRLALTLRELHGLTPLEIARVTDCSYPTSRWRLHRARSLFRKAWEKRFGAPPTPGSES